MYITYIIHHLYISLYQRLRPYIPRWSGHPSNWRVGENTTPIIASRIIPETSGICCWCLHFWWALLTPSIAYPFQLRLFGHRKVSSLFSVHIQVSWFFNWSQFLKVTSLWAYSLVLFTCIPNTWSWHIMTYHDPYADGRPSMGRWVGLVWVTIRAGGL
jgi:hypothetical protein